MRATQPVAQSRAQKATRPVKTGDHCQRCLGRITEAQGAYLCISPRVLVGDHQPDPFQRCQDCDRMVERDPDSLLWLAWPEGGNVSYNVGGMWHHHLPLRTTLAERTEEDK